MLYPVHPVHPAHPAHPAYPDTWHTQHTWHIRHTPLQDVLDAMRSLIENVLGDAGVGGEQFMETSGLKLRELLVWQLITGYKVRGALRRMRQDASQLTLLRRTVSC